MMWGRRPAMARQLKALSGTGLLCYLFLCIETYLSHCYPETDWTPVAKRMWPWTAGYWAFGWDTYWVAVPTCLLEYDSYEQAHAAYEQGRNLAKPDFSEAEYNELRRLFAGVTSGDPEEELNRVLLLPIDFCNDCDDAPPTRLEPCHCGYFEELKRILDAHGIPMPDVAEAAKLPACRRGTKESRQDFAETSALSILLQPNARQLRREEPGCKS